MRNSLTFKRFIFHFILFFTSTICAFSQEDRPKKIFLGINELFSNNQKFNREFSIYGEYHFNDWVGIGIKGVFEDQKDDTLDDQNNKYFIYALMKTPISKDNEFVILKPSMGIGYAEEDKKLIFNASFDINFYIIKDFLYSGVVISSYIIPGSRFRTYTGVNIGVSF